MSRDSDDASPLGFADEPGDPLPPPVRDPAADDPPRKKRKKMRRPDDEADDPLGSVRAKPRVDILDRPDVPPRVGWWVAPVVVMGIGGLMCLVPIVFVAVKVGVETGFVAMAAMAVAIPVQIAAVTVLLTVVGKLFGIEYGPVREALLKLAAVVTIIDGMTGTFVLCNNPCGLMAAAVLGAGVFQFLFKLQIHEMLLSVAGMVFFAFLLNGLLLSMLISNAMPQ